MHTLRKYLSWVFGFAALVNLQLAVSFTLRDVHRYHSHLHARYLLAPGLCTVQAMVFGMAWWTVWKEKRSGRIWGIAASALNLALPLSMSYFAGPGRGLLLVRHFSLLLVIGLIGLFAFLRSYGLAIGPSKPQVPAPIPGDGTSELLNKLGARVLFAAAFGAYFWWLSWLKARDLPSIQGVWRLIVVMFLLDIIVTTLHELGHAAVGLVLGMKLRTFMAGPFQWRILDGKWSFQFIPAAVLLPGGATGLVPVSANFPLWRVVWMAAGGPFITLITGTAALITAYTAPSDSAVQAGGLLMLFGAFSLLLFVANLVPFRTPNNYSDGAQIYQLLSNGPWGDFHRICAMIGSTLVTPLRPRNYEIDLIRRAALVITRGQQGLILQLFAYSHFLDQGKFDEAGQALLEAEAIYNQSASNISPELATVFVFGNAFVRRDAASARKWWTRMQAKKPTRYNVDYWRAFSALQWIEGNLTEADCALKKAEVLAEKLPEAGAYEFDRYCNSLLRRAIEAGCPTSNDDAATEQIVG